MTAIWQAMPLALCPLLAARDWTVGTAPPDFPQLTHFCLWGMSAVMRPIMGAR